MRKLYNGYTEERWEKILNDPYLKVSLDATVAKADKYISEPIEVIKYSSLHLFETTGNRTEFERPYNLLNNRVDMLFLGYLITKNDKYIEPLIDSIWELCNLESWSLSAHVSEGKSLAERRGWLELCSSNVGRRLGEIVTLIGDKFPELVVRRIKHEIRERVVESFKKYKFWWNETHNNWASVCIAGVLGAYLYVATDEEIEEQLPRMCEIADNFLLGYDDEGCCGEGYGYWGYGFEHFCMFAEMLKNYTNGKIDYFKMDKVHAIAKFQENMSINDNECIRFSDCNGKFAPEAPISQYLKSIYPDVQIPAIPAPTTPLSLTKYLWINSTLAVSEMNPASVIFKNNQWFIHRDKSYTLACKAGCNREMHNHLDVGSFMISKNGRVTFTDPGGGEYTRQYFDQSERYGILEPSARAHSIPYINGKMQVLGDKRSTIYVENENEYAFSMENAYDDDSLTSLRRHFNCQSGCVILTDRYEFNKPPVSIVERFVTLHEPILKEGRVMVLDTTLKYNPSLYSVAVLTDTCVRKGGLRETLYMIEFTVKEPKSSLELTFKFE